MRMHRLSLNISTYVLAGFLTCLRSIAASFSLEAFIEM